MTETRTDIEQAYVNAYRNAWGSNSGLSTERINHVSDYELRRDTKALNDFTKLRLGAQYGAIYNK